MQRFNRKITRDDAKNMTVADVLQKVEEGNWGNKAEFAADWQEFVSCWNEIYRLINVDDHTRLDELRNECVTFGLCNHLNIIFYFECIC